MAMSSSYSPDEVTAIMTVFDKLLTAYRFDNSTDGLEMELPDEEVGTPTKVSAKDLFIILADADIDNGEFMEEEFEQLLPEPFVLNCDGPSYWLS